MSEKKNPGKAAVAGLFVGGLAAGAALVTYAMKKINGDNSGSSGSSDESCDSESCDD